MNSVTSRIKEIKEITLTHEDAMRKVIDFLRNPLYKETSDHGMHYENCETGGGKTYMTLAMLLHLAMLAKKI